METYTRVQKFQQIPLSQIKPDPNQPRKDLDLPSMVSSIRKFGIRDPITVRRHRGNFIIIVGERRFRAYTELKFAKIPAMIDESGVDPTITR